ncbi:DNA repair ATPase [Haliovirga abyssi]|uniref:ATPase AAA n=1 Tax=Haliovirga abyssi TaxID=2996794 RepID=A0AAU9E1V6_9FUSO|nr:DNA repair ATPase [Haliovirga abyssi]BDU50370.1 ATPase AAA [Haliovirga abyssi]
MGNVETIEKTEEKKGSKFEAYNVIRKRLVEQSNVLKDKIDKLNVDRIKIFGKIENGIKKTEMIVTENSCIPRDIVPIQNKLILGYNVQMGLKTTTDISDIFSIYEYNEDSLKKVGYELIDDDKFKKDLKDLYKYYKESFFAKFFEKENILHMVFQNGKNEEDIKSFKWILTSENKFVYLGNRFSHEVEFPKQQELNWIKTKREDQISGLHPHISINDKIFVETIEGDLTLKIENNTETGKGIYSEEVENLDQNLDDSEIYYAEVGNLILLKIKPYQEKTFRNLVFNEKTKEVIKVDGIEEACVLLPENQGIIFPNGSVLQSGGGKIFDINHKNMVFEIKKSSNNGEDYQYIFYNKSNGEYYIYNYNIINQEIIKPVICNGYSHFKNGDMIVFKEDSEPKRSHTIQIWKTSFSDDNNIVDEENKNNFLYNLGNKEIVKLMADCHSLYKLIKKDDSYYGLYIDINKESEKIKNNYFWINKKEAYGINSVLEDIKKAAAVAINEFDKVDKEKENNKNRFNLVKSNVENIIKNIKYSSFETIYDFVNILNDLRKSRGEISSLKELKFIEISSINNLENEVKENNLKIAEKCVDFLMGKDSLNPYVDSVKEIEEKLDDVKKAITGKELSEKINEVSEELEILINVVNNLKIEDTTKSSEILDKISLLFSRLNQSKSKLNGIVKNLGSKEKKGEFFSKLNLLSQSVSNFLEIADTSEKLNNYLTKLIVQLDELESNFSEFEEFIPQITEKREEIISSFETKKQQIVDKKNRKIDSLFKASERVLKGIENRVNALDKIEDINEIFSADLMIEKLRDIIDKLTDLGEGNKADGLENKIKVLKENSIKQLKDKKELFLDKNTIKLGNNNFLINDQKIELALLKKDDGFYFNISGTDFYEKIDSSKIEKYRDVWEQEVISENKEVYRAEFLAYKILKKYKINGELEKLYAIPEEDLKDIIKNYILDNFKEYYVKGVHDVDGFLILKELLIKEKELELGAFDPITRGAGNLFWEYGLDNKNKEKLLKRLKSINLINKFSNKNIENGFLPELEERIGKFVEDKKWIKYNNIKDIANYIAKEIGANKYFVMSLEAKDLYEEFINHLKTIGAKNIFDKSLEDLKEDIEGKYIVIKEWINSFILNTEKSFDSFIYELISIIILDNFSKRRVLKLDTAIKIKGLVGQHKFINQTKYEINYNDFMLKLEKFNSINVPKFIEFQKLKQEEISQMKEKLKFEEFMPKVLLSFVRNKLIDNVYLPLIGNNLAKQIGAAGANKRTDNMGVLLLISPPGYGKTTLVEYISNRLNMLMVKVNCPTIGNSVTSLDPEQADNINAKEELLKLNMAFEIGNNIMIYLDDIQHSNPEFLQKFISLCDGQRKIDGVYKGRSKTYDFRGKKVAVVMAGNPYTESGAKFQIPDMLSNRADVYNLGDMLKENEEAFKLSYVENAVTSNVYLNKIYMKDSSNIYKLIKVIETGNRDNIEFNGNYTEQDISEALEVMKKMLKVRDEVLNVNMEYIYSASQSEEYRVEPSFKLQGSYRNMNKISEKIIPIMNNDELRKLIEISYENDSQTLATDSEASILKFKEITERLNEDSSRRWTEIKNMYIKNKTNDGSDKIISLTKAIRSIGRSIDRLKKNKKYSNDYNKKKDDSKNIR